MSTEEVIEDTEVIEEDTPKRGFVTLGINTDKDNMRYCYTLACSIKICDPNASITMVVDKGQLSNVPSYYNHVFDYMVELPYGNSAHKDGFHGMNLWQVYHCTPYDETIYVDYDTLFLDVDLHDLWATMANGGISVPSHALSYRNIPVMRPLRFEFEIAYKLPQNFFNLLYFKKGSIEAEEWFKMADPVMQNWREVYNYICTDKKPDKFEKNLLCNAITHFIDLPQMTCHLTTHYDLHVMSHGSFEDPDSIPKNWTEMLNYWINGKKIQIENSVLSGGIIHYSDETFLTDEVMNVFRTKLTERLQKR